MRTIWKYQLDMAYKTVVEMPMGATVLQFQNQGGAMTFWALVDTEAATEERAFYVAATGKPFPEMDEGMIYMGTVQERGYVWHIFEAGRDVNTATE